MFGILGRVFGGCLGYLEGSLTIVRDYPSLSGILASVLAFLEGSLGSFMIVWVDVHSTGAFHADVEICVIFLKPLAMFISRPEKRNEWTNPMEAYVTLNQ